MKNWISCLTSPRNSNSIWDDRALLILRVFAGLSMAFAHGLGKLPPPDMLVQGVAGIGFPMPEFFAWNAALAEFLGGLLLVLGLLTRPAAAAIAFTMLIAAFVVHAADPYQVKEMAFLYLFIALFFMIMGPGRYSVDRLLNKRQV